MSCPNCSQASPIQDEGTVLFHSNQPTLLLKLSQLLSGQPDDRISYDKRSLPFRYHSKELLLEALNTLYSRLEENEQSELRVEILENAAILNSITKESLPLSQFFARMKHHNLVKLMTEGHFTSHMQPILDMQSRQVFGYELVLRAASGQPSFQPSELFSVAQQTGLHSFLDRTARITAIQVSAELLPRGVKRFVNFLPSSIYNPNYCLSHTFQAIDQYALDPQDFVFEVVETERIEDVTHLKNIFGVYRQHGIKVALDDVGSGFSTLEVLAELTPDYVKIDRSLVDHCDQDESKQQQIKRIVESSLSFGAIVLAEGMERKEEWDYCREQGISLAQGYLMGKPTPAPLTTEHIVF